MQIADNLGVPKENRYINISPTQKQLKASYVALLNMTRKKTQEGIPHLIFTYVGGHGATSEEKQIFLLNDENPKNATWMIELKLRYLVQDITSLARIFAVFDCCRVQISNMPGLATGRGAGAQEVDEDSIEEDAPNKFFYLTACAPGGIADADGGFAKKVLDTCTKHASRKPEGFMYWPKDFQKVRWLPGELSTTGGEDYLVPFSG